MRSKKPIKVTIEQIKAFYALPQEKAKENERIVRKAIQKALQQGWFPDYVQLDSGSLISAGRTEIRYRDKEGLCVRILNGSFNDILFNDGFAKALWGEEMLCRDCGTRIVRDMKTCCLVGNKYRFIVPAWLYQQNLQSLRRISRRRKQTCRRCGGPGFASFRLKF